MMNKFLRKLLTTLLAIASSSCVLGQGKSSHNGLCCGDSIFSGTLTRTNPITGDSIVQRYDDGILISKSEYFKTGILAKSCVFNPDLGECVSFYPSGVMKSSQRFVDGVPDGQLVEWHPNQKLSRIANFQSGKKEGSQYRWSHDDRLVSELWFENDTLIGANYWHQSGKLSHSIDKNSGISVEYDTLGRVIIISMDASNSLDQMKYIFDPDKNEIIRTERWSNGALKAVKP